MEMENHKAVLDKEYESLITQFTKELERLQVKHNQEMEKKVRYCDRALYFCHIGMIGAILRSCFVLLSYWDEL